MKLHQANSSQEDDSGNDGDDERDERSVPSEGRDADITGERPREDSVFHNAEDGNDLDVGQEEDEGEAAASDAEGSISDGNESCEEGSVSSHSLEVLDNEDCDKEDNHAVDADNDERNLTDGNSSSGDCHKACLGMSSRTRSNCSLKEEGESSSLTPSRQSVSFFIFFQTIKSTILGGSHASEMQVVSKQTCHS